MYGGLLKLAPSILEKKDSCFNKRLKLFHVTQLPLDWDIFLMRGHLYLRIVHTKKSLS